MSHRQHPAHGESLIKAIARLAVLLAAALVVPAPPAAASEGVRLAYTPRVFHVTQDDDYVDWNHIVALEFLTPRHVFWGADRTHFGVSVFDNSYGQFSQSIYAGLEWDWQPALGVGLTLVPAIGWQRDALGFAASLNGSASALRISWSFMAPSSS